LFDQSTLAAGHVKSQKVEFAKQILKKLKEIRQDHQSLKETWEQNKGGQLSD